MTNVVKVLRSVLVLILPLWFIFSQPAFSEDSPPSSQGTSNERADVLKTFTGTARGEMVVSYDEQRFQHQVLFIMGAFLLVFIMLTAGFGVAMAMLGKDVFLPHMICAGISVFLAIAHSVVAIVWFFPFK